MGQSGSTEGKSDQPEAYDVEYLSTLYNAGTVGSESISGGFDDLMSKGYEDKSALLNRIVGILRATLGLKDRPASNQPSDLADFIRKNIPDRRPLYENKKNFKVDATGHARIVNSIVAEINKFSGREQIQKSDDYDHMIRQILEIVNSIGVGTHKELVSVSADIGRSLNNLMELRVLQKNTFDKLASEFKENIAVASSIKSLYELLDNECKRQIDILSNITHSTLKPVESDMAKLLQHNKDFKGIVDSITAKLGTVEFSDKLASLMSGIGNTTVMISNLERALKTIGLSMKDYKSKNLSELKVIAMDKLSQLTPHLNSEALEAHQKSIDFLTRAEPHKEMILSKLSGKYGGCCGVCGAYHDEKEHTYGAYEPTLSEKLKKSSGTRSKVVAEFKEQSKLHFDNITRDIDTLGDLLGKQIHLTDDVDQLIRSIRELERINKEGIEYALSGAHLHPTAVEEKTKFLSQLSAIKMSLDPLLKSPAQSYFKSLDSHIDSLVNLINTYNSIHGVLDSTTIGGGKKKHHRDKYIPSEESISSIILDEDIVMGGGAFKHAVDLKTAIGKLTYMYNTAKLIENMKHVASKLDDGKEYEMLLGESMSSRIDEIRRENETFNKSLDESDIATAIKTSSLGNAFYPDSKFTVDDIKSIHADITDARITLLKTAQAIDLITHKSRDDLLRTTETKDIIDQLEGMEMIRKWFNERTGNRLAATFEFFPCTPDFSSDILKHSDVYGALLGSGDELKIDNHYYTVFNPSHSCAGNPFIPVDPSTGKRIIRFNKTTFENLMALKNIISLFASSGNKDIAFSTFLSPIQIHNNLVQYLAISCLSIGGRVREDLQLRDETSTSRFELSLNRVTSKHMHLYSKTTQVDTIQQLVKRAMLYGNVPINITENPAFTVAARPPPYFGLVHEPLNELSTATKMKTLRNAISELTEFKKWIEQDKPSVVGYKSRFVKFLHKYFNSNAIIMGHINNTDFRIGDFKFGEVKNRGTSAANRITLASPDDVKGNILALVWLMVLIENRGIGNITYNDALSATTIGIKIPLVKDTVIINSWSAIVVSDNKFNPDVKDGDIDIKPYVSFPDVPGTDIQADYLADRFVGKYILAPDKDELTLNQLIQLLTIIHDDMGSDLESKSLSPGYGSKVDRTRSQFGITMSSISENNGWDGERFASGYKNIFQDEDQIFILCIKAMISKILVSVGIHRYLNYSGQSTMPTIISPIRFILGAGDDESEPVEIKPDAIELYIRLSLLLEFYKTVFAFSSDSGKAVSAKKISMAPEMSPRFSGLFRLVYDRMEGEIQTSYTRSYTESLIKEMNQIYIRYYAIDRKDVCSRIISDVISEVNFRYGMMTNGEIEQYKDEELKRRKLFTYGVKEDVTSYNILDEDKLGSGVAPSDKFSSFSTGLRGKSKYDTAHRLAIKDFRTRIERALGVTDMSDIQQISSGSLAGIGEQISLAKTALSAATLYDDKIKIVMDTLQGINVLYKKDEQIYIMFHETVVHPIMLLEVVRARLENLDTKMKSIDVKKVLDAIKEVWKVDPKSKAPSVNGAYGELANKLLGYKAGTVPFALLTNGTIRDALTKTGLIGVTDLKTVLRDVTAYNLKDSNYFNSTGDPAADAKCCKLDNMLSSMNMIGSFTTDANAINSFKIDGKIIADRDVKGLPTSTITTSNGFKSDGKWDDDDAKMVHQDNLIMFGNLLINWEHVLYTTIELISSISIGLDGLVETRIQASTPILDFNKLKERIVYLVGYVRKQIDTFRSIIDIKTLQKYESGDDVSIKTLTENLLDRYFTKSTTSIEYVNTIIKNNVEAAMTPFPRELVSYTVDVLAKGVEYLTVGKKASNLFIPLEMVFSSLTYYNPYTSSKDKKWPGDSANVTGFLSNLTLKQTSTESIGSILLKSYSDKSTEILPSYVVRYELYSDQFYMDSFADDSISRKDGRGIIMRFNETMADYLGTLFDKTTNKIYLPLIKFADGSLSPAVMKGLSFPDVVASSLSHTGSYTGPIDFAVANAGVDPEISNRKDDKFANSMALRLASGLPVEDVSSNNDWKVSGIWAADKDNVKSATAKIKNAGIVSLGVLPYLGFNTKYDNIKGIDSQYDIWTIRMNASAKGYLPSTQKPSITSLHSIYNAASRFVEYKNLPFAAGWEKRTPLFIGFKNMFMNSRRRMAFLTMRISLFSSPNFNASYAIPGDTPDKRAHLTTFASSRISDDKSSYIDSKNLKHVTFDDVCRNAIGIKLMIKDLTVKNSYAEVFCAIVNEILANPSLTTSELLISFKLSPLYKTYESKTIGDYKTSFDDYKFYKNNGDAAQDSYDVFDNFKESFNSIVPYDEIRGSLHDNIKLLINLSMALSTGELWMSVVTNISGVSDLIRHRTLNGLIQINTILNDFKASRSNTIGKAPDYLYRQNDKDPIGSAKGNVNFNLLPTYSENRIAPFFFELQCINSKGLLHYIKESQFSINVGGAVIDDAYINEHLFNANNLTTAESFVSINVCNYLTSLIVVYLPMGGTLYTSLSEINYYSVDTKFNGIFNILRGFADDLFIKKYDEWSCAGIAFGTGGDYDTGNDRKYYKPAVGTAMYNTITDQNTEVLTAIKDDRYQMFDYFNNLVTKYKIYAVDTFDKYGAAFTGKTTPTEVSFSLGTATTKFGDPNDVLFASLARSLRTLLISVDSKSNKRFLLENISDIPSRTKESYKANLPSFIKRFTIIARKVDILRNFYRLMSKNMYRPSVFDANDIPELKSIPDVHSGLHQYRIRDLSETSKMYNVLFDQIQTGCQSIIMAATSVLSELDDNPLYMEIYENSITEHRTTYNKIPLMPLSLMSYVFSENVLPHLHTNKSSEFPLTFGQSLETMQFKFGYGVRQLLMKNTMPQLESAPYVAELINKYNAVSSSGRKMVEESYNKFFSTMIYLLRWTIDSSLMSGIFCSDVTRFNNPITSADAKYSHVKPLGSSDTLSIITDSDISNPVKQLLSKIEFGSSKGYSKRSVLLAANIIEMNKMPIDINALRKEVALSNLYNFGFTFDSIVHEMFGLCGGVIDSNKSMMCELLCNPYKSVSESEFHKYVQGLMEGSDQIKFGRDTRSKFADELWNKGLLQTTTTKLQTKLGKKVITGSIESRADAIGFVASDKLVYPSSDSERYKSVTITTKLKETLVDLGRLRFDTTLIRNITFITNAFRFLRHKMLNKVFDTHNPVLSDISMLKTDITDVEQDQVASEVDEYMGY